MVARIVSRKTYSIELTMSSTTKHTPGPWSTAIVVRDFASVIDEKHGQYIADVYDRSDDDGNGETEANARLIAAAPDLLEAAKDVCSLLFSLENVDNEHPAYKALKEAIKKAQP